MAEGIQAEVGIVGQEGMLWNVAALGSRHLLHRGHGADAGDRASDGHAELPARGGRGWLFRTLLLRYNEALQAQVMQTPACNGHHGLEQRLARWLLMAHDRADGNELCLTQDFMAMMLGVHRPSLTVAAGVLQRAGLIRHSGGRVTVIDRPGLEAASCECYGAVRRRFLALLGPARSWDVWSLTARPGWIG